MDFTDPKTILVVQIGKIGDMILTTPLLAGIKKLFPQSNLKVLASDINKDIPLNHDSADEVIIYQKNLLKNIFLRESSLNNIDLWIDTKDNYSRTSEMLLKKYKPAKSLGFNFDKKIFDISLNEYVNGVHAVDINLSSLYYFNSKKDAEELRPTFNIPPDIAKKFENNFNSDKLKILVNISAGNESRYLENKKWIEIIIKISGIKTSEITLIGLESDSKRINEIVRQFPGEDVKYIETKNILEAGEIVRRNDIIISPDTSIIHICSAFNKPVVGLYPDVKWNLEKFRPLSDKYEIVISRDAASIKDITADEVVKNFENLLKKISGNAESRTRVRKEDH